MYSVFITKLVKKRYLLFETKKQNALIIYIYKYVLTFISQILRIFVT